MNFIKKTTWKEIFDEWEKREANNPGWVRCATEVKGWPDWKSWKNFSASQINADERDWQILEFTDPINEVSQMLVGPYTGWQSRFSEKNTGTFENLLNDPKQYDFFSKHEAVISIMNNLPFPTEFIGLIRDDTNKIVCLEGHHRATAIAMAKKQGKQIDFGNKIKIALAHLGKDEISLLDEMLKRGSSKNPSSAGLPLPTGRK